MGDKEDRTLADTALSAMRRRVPEDGTTPGQDKLKPTQKPLIPAKAGNQILWRKSTVISGGLLSFGLSFVIWIPAFAGMSGVYIELT